MPTCSCTRSNDCWSARTFLPWTVWHNRISSNKAAKLWTHWSQPFCRRPQGETHGVQDTSFWNSSERTQQQSLYLSPMMCSSYQKRTDHSFALHSTQIHASQPASWCHSQCSSFQTLCSHPTFWDSDWNQSNSPPVTCVILIMSKMSRMFCSSVPMHPHVISLCTKYAFLLPPTGAQEMFTFLSLNNNKLYIFLHELIAFYEQAS